MIARPVGKEEKEKDEGGRYSRAVKDEWAKLHKRNVFAMYEVREWADVAREARKEWRVVHMGHAFGIMVEKNSELQKGDPLHTQILSENDP